MPLRDRIRRRFADRQAERDTLEAQIALLTSPATRTADPKLLDALPILATDFTAAPARLQQQLYAALNLEMIYKKDMHQVSIYATLTDTTPATLAAILTPDHDQAATPTGNGTRKDSLHGPRGPLSFVIMRYGPFLPDHVGLWGVGGTKSFVIMSAGLGARRARGPCGRIGCGPAPGFLPLGSRVLLARTASRTAPAAAGAPGGHPPAGGRQYVRADSRLVRFYV